MIATIKIVLVIAILLLLSYPFLVFKGPLRKISIAAGLRFHTPKNGRNIVFAILAIVEFVAFYLLFRLFDGLAQAVYAIPFVGQLLSSVAGSLSSQTDYILFALKLILINLIAIYLFVFAKAFVKKLLIDLPAFIKKKIIGTKEKKQQNEEPSDPTGSKRPRNRRITNFMHTAWGSINDEDDPTTQDSLGEDPADVDEKTDVEDDPKYGRFTAWFLGLFFEGDEFQYARGWVIRVRAAIQIFVRLIQYVYLLFFLAVMLSAFFVLPTAIYDFLIHTIRLQDWYLYPVFSVLFLQEICNTLDAAVFKEKTAEEKRAEKEKAEEKKRSVQIRELLAELKKRFDSEHFLRYYPETVPDEVPAYECKNVMYASALNYIRSRMRQSSGHVVQSYMECLDAIYSDNHVYFSASFYSELGEYLIAYTYIRLLSGARQVFVVSDPAEKETLRTYISDRLMKMTGSSPMANWRVYTTNERLEQADVLIATPDDFVNSDIIDQHPRFFEEVCNAIFIDADRLIAMDSYVCPIMATRLKNATAGRIRFVFLTLNLIKGFAARSLPRFFCVDTVLSISSAKENESVSYVLWNKESKKHRIYNKNVQKSVCVETIIAEQACKHGIDGVRLITQAPIDHAERKLLSSHKVEINNLYKNVVDVNYMIYSDDRYNLSAALYACTRFRGKKKSVVHILSKPYLLREYFMSKAITEDHINRSSFIQPRVTEHVERHRFSLVRVFCDATTEDGIPVSEFERRVKDIITATKERNDCVSSAYCRSILAGRKTEEMKLADLAAYLVAGICDDDGPRACADEANKIAASSAYDAKNYYIVIESTRNAARYTGGERRIVFNRVKSVFGRLSSYNRRVALRLNDEQIGWLDTFPSRVHQEYVEGQNIIYNNAEYEIDRITPDGRSIYLRSENINIKNCLDTTQLRYYELQELIPNGKSAVLGNSKSVLSEIRVTRYNGSVTGTTYGFYSLSSDRQTLDFHKGVEGNWSGEHPNVREYSNAKILGISLSTDMECTDGMRLLMTAVFNEFIRTIFPDAYRCIAVCPVLTADTVLAFDPAEKDAVARIKTLYPFLHNPGESFVETDSKRMQFYMINDCEEEVGVLDWFYDNSGRYVQEFLANVYSYLRWLELRPGKAHYIYFGGESLPDCYDLEGCCNLLRDYNFILSDDGEEDIETAGDDLESEKLERCSFCHKQVESGRYSYFDQHRFICADCFDVVSRQHRLEELYATVRDYLEGAYPSIVFGPAKVTFDPVYDLTTEQILSEFYYREDFSTRTIYVELDNPVNNAAVSILRGLISFWQADNSLVNHYAPAQLYYEELCYLRSIGQNESADWIYNAVPVDVQRGIDEIIAYVKGTAAKSTESGEEPIGTPEAPPATDTRTSFDFLREKTAALTAEPWNGEDPTDEEYSDELYDPNSVPRFWKRYLRGGHLDDKQEEVPTQNGESGDPVTGEEDPTGATETPTSGETPTTGETPIAGETPKKRIKRPFFGKKKNADDPTEPGTVSSEDPKTDPYTAEKPKKKRKGLFKRLSPGEKILPKEEDEDTNPKIRVYNEMVRAAYNYSEEPISRCGLSEDDLQRVFKYVCQDYPELFWVEWYGRSETQVWLVFRCKDANGRFDVAQVNRKRKELRKGAKEFTRGISKKTDPYEALLTIYRRVIRCFDYDSIGLEARVDQDETRDDILRSLHSALVTHKVVCAGYAVAMQYLLQSVGIVCGYVSSEYRAKNGHAFNILKLGKYCYYLDSTWGDMSDTQEEGYQDFVRYNYFCVPYEEFIRTSPGIEHNHVPNASFYPELEKFNYTNHEYYRYHNAYLTSYDEKELVRIFAETALAYNEKKMGEFSVGFRCPTPEIAFHTYTMLREKGRQGAICAAAAEIVKKTDKKAAKLLERNYTITTPYKREDMTGVITIFFLEEAGSEKKRKKSE